MTRGERAREGKTMDNENDYVLEFNFITIEYILL